jgi:hypothetical protein
VTSRFCSCLLCLSFIILSSTLSPYTSLSRCLRDSLSSLIKAWSYFYCSERILSTASEFYLIICSSSEFLSRRHRFYAWSIFTCKESCSKGATSALFVSAINFRILARLSLLLLLPSFYAVPSSLILSSFSTLLLSKEAILDSSSYV